MKRIIILVLLMAAQAHGGFFQREDDRVMREYQQQLELERHTTGGWEIIAGIFGLGAIVLFGVGTAIGSKTRKRAKTNE